MKNVLPIGVGLLDLAGYKEVLRDRAEESEADFIFDQVADDGAVDSIARYGCELMPMVPGFEWTLLLYIGEVVVPLEFGTVTRNGVDRKSTRLNSSHQIISY